ncbi:MULTISPECIES: YihY/virulence factor BrkB family protein [unclassified Leuconostoc]|uniref:YihY/virulence factor BrkB family protein n=1 Tax=unclassified Leuconostoc TaxID=2685106 RepID=UPI0019063F9D|nr:MULTISPECIES: YihY/virulence factor BrkB family protein [unclassified Leuconostoc]MBK0039597.1 YihY/virulence factor BrkB family protein [Leuconostoc sp. S51]MBK0050556.1 YihY/virulence factor BrkB family protein [Leuconostoc sp. S50]
MNNKMKQTWRVIDARFKLSTLGELFSRSQIGYVGPTFAYYALLTVFPILMGAAMIVSFTSFSTADLLTAMRNMLPKNIENIVIPIMQSVLASKSASLLSFTVIFTIWSISRVIAVFRKSFNAIADVDERFNNMLTRLFSFLWLLVIIAAFALLMIGSNVLTIAMQHLPHTQWTSFLQHQTRWFIWLGMWLALTMMNFLLPTKDARAPLRFVVIGSFIELLMLNALNKGFTIYAKIAIGKYDFYQSVSSMIVLLIWLNLIATILVLGYVIIKWITEIKWGKDLVSRQ